MPHSFRAPTPNQQQSTIKDWINAARLRTLPLSISGIIMGSFIARWRLKTSTFSSSHSQDLSWDWSVFILALVVTLLFQVLSNFANDFGDGIKGTDQFRINEAEKRAVASGKISAGQMKRAVILMSIASVIMMVILLYRAFFPDYIREFWFFIGLGIACILAAIGYTVGKKPYGYMGLGDMMVFLFFGWVSVCGSYFLFTKTFHWDILLPATAVGLMSAAVLNLNNMRDIETDRLTGKKSLALRLGFRNAMIYQMTLLQLPLILILVWLGLQGFFTSGTYYPFIVMILLFPMMSIRRKIMEIKEPALLDPYLKQVGIMTLMMAILLSFGLNFNS